MSLVRNERYDLSDIKHLYLDKQLSCPQIANIKGCGRSTIQRALGRRGVMLRNNKLAQNCEYLKVDKILLKKLYTEQKLSAYEVSRKLRTSPFIVWRALHHYNIPVRPQKEAAILGIKRGNESPNWTGGRKTDSHGYVWVYKPDHPYATKTGYVREHRLIAEQKLGRFLLPSEQVHHLNGVKDDNTPDNIEVLSPKNHTLRTMFCDGCPVKTEVRRLHKIIEGLENTLNKRMEV